MKRTVYLLIITVITIGCVIIGTVGRTNRGDSWLSFGSLEEESGTEALNQAFHSISIDADVMDITIREGREATLEYTATKDLIPQWQIEGNTLYITNRQKKVILAGKHSCKVILTMPEDSTLKRVEAESDVGDVEWSNIAAKECSIEADVGDVVLENAEFTEADITSNVGDVRWINAVFDSAEVTSDVGDVVIESKHSLEGYSFDIGADVGAVYINGEEYKDTYQSDGEKGSITVTTDVGDAKISY